MSTGKKSFFILGVIISLVTLLSNCAGGPEWKKYALESQELMDRGNFEQAEQVLYKASKASYKEKGGKPELVEAHSRLIDHYLDEFRNKRIDQPSFERKLFHLMVRQKKFLLDELDEYGKNSAAFRGSPDQLREALMHTRIGLADRYFYQRKFEQMVDELATVFENHPELKRDAPDIYAAYKMSLGVGYWHLSEYDRAISELKDSLEVRKEQEKSDHLSNDGYTNMLGTQDWLVKVLKDSGRYAEADRASSQLIELIKRSPDGTNSAEALRRAETVRDEIKLDLESVRKG